MKTRLTAIALVVSMTTASAANAGGQIAGGPIYANGEFTIYCYFVNFGSTKVTPKSQQLFLVGSATPLASESSCPNGSPVAPNQSCYTVPAATLPTNVGTSCKVTFSGSATDVRGALEIFDRDGDALATVELR
jgi:hypothetical protein